MNSKNNQGYGWRNNQNNMPSNRTSETPSEKKLDLEQALAQMLTSHSAFMNETDECLKHSSYTCVGSSFSHLFHSNSIVFVDKSLILCLV